MLALERKQKIRSIVINEKKVYVTALSQQFGVTEETIRKDLEKLEQEGLVTRTYGGALLNSEGTQEDVPFLKRSVDNIDTKRQIAAIASSFLTDGMSVMADASSTVLETLKMSKNKKDMTVITNSVEVINELGGSRMRIISTGGEYKYSGRSQVGAITAETIKRYNVDIALLSCKGINKSKGITDSREEEAEIKKLMAKQAKMVFLLADNSKIDKIAFLKLMDLSTVDYFITNQQMTSDWVAYLKKQNVKVHWD